MPKFEPKNVLTEKQIIWSIQKLFKNVSLPEVYRKLNSVDAVLRGGEVERYDGGYDAFRKVLNRILNNYASKVSALFDDVRLPGDPEKDFEVIPLGTPQERIDFLNSRISSGAYKGSEEIRAMELIANLQAELNASDPNAVPVGKYKIGLDPKIADITPELIEEMLFLFGREVGFDKLKWDVLNQGELKSLITVLVGILAHKQNLTPELLLKQMAAFDEDSLAGIETRPMFLARLKREMQTLTPDEARQIGDEMDAAEIEADRINREAKEQAARREQSDRERSGDE